MSKIQFTARQEQAICGRGDALLVSAAAGSGKTAVLVERVLRYLAEQGGDIRRLIIMTFTEAAAAEMRQKIKTAVDRYLRENGGNDHLMRQSTLIDGAQIGTIHSICRSLITAHFEQLELDPRCRLLDETADAAMIEEQAELLLEDLFGREDAGVRRMLDCYAAGREDDTLKGLLIQGLKFLEKQPLPEDYIRRALAPYERTDEGLFSCFAEDGLYGYILQQLEELQARYRAFINWVERQPVFAEMPLLLELLEEDHRQLCKLPEILEKRDYDGFRAALEPFKFATLTWKKVTEEPPDEETKKVLTDARKKCTGAFLAFKKKFTADEAAELEAIRAEGDLLRTYFETCMELRQRLMENRRKSGWITFQDMEQLAVQLLVEGYDPKTDTLTPTPLALQLRQDYDEIIIDEFQDTNRAQDLIFRALSQDEKNLFMVGDIKQSIYRFRGAEPEIFNQKRAQSAPYADGTLSQKTVLELNANFRSHPGVLRFANRVFESIMSPELGGVCYDEREQLVPGRAFLRPEDARAEIHWLAPAEDPRTGKKLKVTDQNARYTAQLIAKAVAQGEELLLPDGQKRPVEYRDFAILLRTTAGAASVFEKELQKLGIPVVNRNESTRFFELPEVQSILSYLLVLNNPYDDVALVSLLYGDYFRFTVGELAAMRHRKMPLYDDLRQSAEQGGKAQKAYTVIENYRRLAGTLYVYDLLYRIYQESGVFAAYAAEDGGAEKCANLELLAEDARRFEKDGYRGLYAFVQHIRLTGSGVESGARLKAEENSVRIMSMHKSKGLEFPICILGDCGKELNLRDIKARILFHGRYGAALEDIRPELYLRTRSLSQEVLADQMFADCISEDERVLYVALTRAVSKTVVLLHMAPEQLESRVGEAVGLGKALPAWLLKKSGVSYADWLIALMAGSREGAALRSRFGLPEGDHPALGAAWIEGTLEEEPERAVMEKQKTEPFDRKAFRMRLDWQYPHLSAVRLPAKLSVSELKGLREQDEDAEHLLEERVRLAEPRFVSRFRPRGNEVGNALHQALQFSDFGRLKEDPEAELERLVREGFILEKQRQLISLEQLRRFTESAAFCDLLSADYYSKEERFLFPMPASELFGPEAEGEILIQGVLDCYSVRDGRAVILDYKTDRVGNEEELIKRYQVQMDLYEEALRRVKGLAVERREIYSFSLGKSILV